MPKHKNLNRLYGFTAMLLVAGLVLFATPEADIPDEMVEEIYIPHNFRMLSLLDSSEYTKVLNRMEREDQIARVYSSPIGRKLVLDFFDALGSKPEITGIILDAAINTSVPVSLTMALVKEESAFLANAVNKNPDSVDRGLFQLNSLSFPKLGLSDFFDPATNARYGTAHLAYCLEAGGNEIAALAMYNAGFGRVSKGGTPRQTLDYIHRITTYRSNMEALFEAQVIARLEAGIAKIDSSQEY